MTRTGQAHTRATSTIPREGAVVALHKQFWWHVLSMGNVLLCDAEKALANATDLCFKFASNACLAGTSSKLEMYTS